MDKIVPSFEKTLFSNNIELLSEIGEIGIDSILNNELIKKLPIVSILIGVKNTAQNLQDRNLLKQTMMFTKEIYKSNIDEEKFNKYKDKLNSNSQFAEKELGRVLLILNNNIDDKKSEYFANIFLSYIYDVITWDEFCELADIITRIFLGDISFLKEIYKKNVTISSPFYNYQIYRLSSLGILDYSSAGFTFGYTKANDNLPLNLNVSNRGRKLCEIIFDKLYLTV